MPQSLSFEAKPAESRNFLESMGAVRTFAVKAGELGRSLALETARLADADVDEAFALMCCGGTGCRAAQHANGIAMGPFTRAAAIARA